MDSMTYEQTTNNTVWRNKNEKMKYENANDRT